MTSHTKTADFLLSLGFEERAGSNNERVFFRAYRKHDGRIEAQLVTLDQDGQVIQGTVPPYQAITRSFGKQHA